MKGKILTSWSLVWLLATILLVTGGALNLSQRANHAFPPTDGVLWKQKSEGIYAEKVTPNLQPRVRELRSAINFWASASMKNNSMR
jgi:hypothetical protein